MRQVCIALFYSQRPRASSACFMALLELSKAWVPARCNACSFLRNTLHLVALDAESIVLWCSTTH